jgi:hypothetical protein
MQSQADDDDNYRRIKSHQRLAIAAGLVVAFACLSVSVMLRPPSWGAFLMTAAAVLLVLRLVRRRTPLPADIQDQHKAEYIRRQRPSVLVWLPISNLFFLWAIYRLANYTFPFQATNWMVVATFICSTLGNLSILMGVLTPRGQRAVAEDELTALHRSQALRAGYLFLLLMVVVAFVVTIYDPGKASKMLPIMLSLGVAVPSFWFAGTEWMADRDR